MYIFGWVRFYLQAQNVLSGQYAFRPICKKLFCSYFDRMQLNSNTKNWLNGGGPGQVVMGGDSCSKGCEFESRHCILDGHLFTFICCKNYNLCVWKDENTWRRGRGWPIFVKWIKFFLAKEVWRQKTCF